MFSAHNTFTLYLRTFYKNLFSKYWNIFHKRYREESSYIRESVYVGTIEKSI